MSGDTLAVEEYSENIYSPDHKKSRESATLQRVIASCESERDRPGEEFCKRTASRAETESKMPPLSPLLIKVSKLISGYLLLWDPNIALGVGVIGNIEVTEHTINDASGEDVTINSRLVLRHTKLWVKITSHCQSL